MSENEGLLTGGKKEKGNAISEVEHVGFEKPKYQVVE